MSQIQQGPKRGDQGVPPNAAYTFRHLGQVQQGHQRRRVFSAALPAHSIWAV
jgi:hypothetical protein